MEHVTSSRHGLRWDRISRSPYARPEPSIKRSSSSSTLASLRSILSHVPSLFSRSTTSILPTTHRDIAETQSESGSEDGWNGEPPATMGDADVFDLAAVGGRSGQEFEDRAAEWRSKGEIPGGRRQMARQNLLDTATMSSLEPTSPKMPGYLAVMKPSPSMPALTSPTPDHATSRASENSRLSSRNPLPSFASAIGTTVASLRPQTAPPPRKETPAVVATPRPASAANVPQPIPISTPSTFDTTPQPVTAPTPGTFGATAGSRALAAFLEAKRGQHLTPEDIEVIESLTRNMKAESLANSPPRDSPKEHVATGGWSAGTYTPRFPAVSSAASSLAATPSRSTQNLAETPGSVFSLGRAPPLSTSSGRVTYLGPGMSPRRMLRKPRGSVRALNLSTEEDGAAMKKRLIDGTAKDTSSRTEITPAAALPTRSLFSPTTLQDSRRPLEFGKSQITGSTGPGGFSQPATSTTQTSTRPDAVSAGKKRAAEIMKELIEADVGPLESSKPDYMIINPYDNHTTTPSTSSSTPKHVGKISSPRTPLLRSSIKGKDTEKLRGAAAKLAEHNTPRRKLTVLEIIQGKRPHIEPSSHADLPTPPRRHSSEESFEETNESEENNEDDAADEMEVDLDTDLAPSASSPAPRPREESPAPTTKPYTTARIPDPEPIQPFKMPELTLASQPIPTYQSTSSFSRPFGSPIQSAALAAAQPAPKLTFTPSAPVFTPADNTDARSDPSARSTKPISKSKNPEAVFLSAKDCAMAVDKAALPFYTFATDLPADDSTHAKAKAEALKRVPPKYAFAIDDAPKPVALPSKSLDSRPWTCSLCVLQNPATATEKCIICEAPKPKSCATATLAVSKSIPLVSSPLATHPPFTASSSRASSPAAGETWRCGLCGLLNSDSARDTCSICEHPRR